ncbi:C40 family peptidase, partial [Streptomyces fagopyri]
ALFLSSNPDDFLDKASAMDQLSSQQVESLKKVQAKQRELAQQRQEASAKLKDLSDTRAELKKKKQEVQGKLASAQKLLNSLTAKEKAALAAQDQERATRASERVDLSNSKAASGRAGAAYAAAQGMIGRPYVYGATGPSSFDCSGLTSWAYAQAGVSIPRTSESQANIGTRIYSQSDLQVGDLVFFFGDLHHVALYAGGGQVLHAPRTGTVVRYESMSTIGGAFQFGVRV